MKGTLLMETPSTRPAFSLRAKLVLSYLGVALGAILLLILVVSIVVQNYFYSTQLDQLRSNAEYIAQQIGQHYQIAGADWDAIAPISLSVPEIYVVEDTTQQIRASSLPAFDIPIFQQRLQQSLQGQEFQGNLQDNNTLAGLYVSVPIYNGGQPNGAIIGALVLAEPLHYPAGFSPNDFLANVDKAILITGSAVAIIVIIFSLWLARRLTRPLTSLTLAAEQMGEGNYAQRVVPPKGRDELARLSLSFNAMAEKIESDVTELHQQDQMRRDLVANIAHDLATPLTAIQGFSEALADDVITDPQARQETAQLIGREVQRLRRLVSDMQQMTSFESGRIQLDREPLDLHTLVNEVLEVIRPECEQAGISLHNEIAPTTPDVLADSDRITQVLLNLLDNARRYTPVGGSITVGARIKEGDLQAWLPQSQIQQHDGAHVQHEASTFALQTKTEGVQAWRPQGKPLHFDNAVVHTAGDTRAKWLSVWVRDTGTGINPDDLPYIFDRFFRGDRARSGANAGSGLGLAIIKAIVAAHGGTIRAESTPAKGTSITFTLPLA
jgi:signal transduction histidine kinase